MPLEGEVLPLHNVTLEFADSALEAAYVRSTNKSASARAISSAVAPFAMSVGLVSLVCMCALGWAGTGLAVCALVAGCVLVGYVPQISGRAQALYLSVLAMFALSSVAGSTSTSRACLLAWMVVADTALDVSPIFIFKATAAKVALCLAAQLAMGAPHALSDAAAFCAAAIVLHTVARQAECVRRHRFAAERGASVVLVGGDAWERMAARVLLGDVRVSTGDTPSERSHVTKRDELISALHYGGTDIISQLDEDGRFVYVSPNCEGAFGYTPSELLGTHAAALLHPDVLDAPESAPRALLERILPELRHIPSGTKEVLHDRELRKLRKDGAVIVMRVRCMVQYRVRDDGREQAYFIVSERDVTRDVARDSSPLKRHDAPLSPQLARSQPPQAAEAHLISSAAQRLTLKRIGKEPAILRARTSVAAHVPATSTRHSVSSSNNDSDGSKYHDDSDECVEQPATSRAAYPSQLHSLQPSAGAIVSYVVNNMSPSHASYVCTKIQAQLWSTDMTGVLNDDAWIEIFKYLSVSDLASVALVCRRFAAISRCDATWAWRCNMFGWGAPSTRSTLGFRRAFLRSYRSHARWVEANPKPNVYMSDQSGVSAVCAGARYLVAACECSVGVWDAVTLGMLYGLSGHADSVLSIDMRGDLLVSGSQDMTAIVWRLSHAYGAPVTRFIGHSGGITHTAFLAPGALSLGSSGALAARPRANDEDPQLLITGSSDGTARLWDVSTGACLTIFAAHEAPITKMRILADGRILTGGANGFLRMSVLRAEGLATNPNSHFGAGSSTMELVSAGCSVSVLACGGDLVFAGVGSDIVVYSSEGVCKPSSRPTPAGSREVARLSGHTASVVCLSVRAEGAVLISGGDDCALIAWAVEEGAGTGGRKRGRVLRRMLGHEGTVNCLLQTRGNRRRYTLSFGASEDGPMSGTACIRCGALFASVDATCTCTEEDVPDLVLSGSEDRTVRVWSPRNWECVYTLGNIVDDPTIRGVTCLALRGNVLAVGFGSTVLFDDGENEEFDATRTNEALILWDFRAMTMAAGAPVMPHVLHRASTQIQPARAHPSASIRRRAPFAPNI